MSTALVKQIEYPNLRSRLLVGPMFKRQFIVPEKPSALLEGFLKFYERVILRPDVSNIKIVKPVFLIGLPRSGTSMLQDLICTHPDLAYITNSMHQFRNCFCAAEVWRKRLKLNAKGERYLGDSVEVDAGSPNDAVAFWSEWLRYDTYSLNYKDRKLSDYTQSQLDFIYNSIRKIIWCFKNPAGRFFSKNPGLVPDTLLLQDLFPDAKFVHIVRDPRMCANSMLKLYRLEQRQLVEIKKQRRHGYHDSEPFVPYPRMPKLVEYAETFGADDIRTTAHVWADAVDFVEDRHRELSSFHQVRYEDIVANPREEIARIIEFAELPAFADSNRQYQDKVGQVGKTHHKNTYGDFDVIEDICRSQMERYGYE